MNFGITTCKVAGYTWLILAGFFILTGTIGVWIKDGFSGVQDLLSPFNVINWVFMVITLAPGIGLIILSEKLKNKSGPDLTQQ